MQTSIEKITAYTAGYTYETFHVDDLAIDATIRNLIIVGEAANHVPLSIKRRYPDVEWVLIRGMRNVVVHQYFEIDLNVLWTTFQHDLQPLATQLQDILANQ